MNVMDPFQRAVQRVQAASGGIVKVQPRKKPPGTETVCANANGARASRNAAVLYDNIEKLQAEVERLRGFLRDIQTVGKENDLWTIKDICREALENK